MRQFIHMPNMLPSGPNFGMEEKCTKDKAGKSTSGLDHPTQVYSLKVDFSDPSWPDHSKGWCSNWCEEVPSFKVKQFVL